jgi:UDP-N-acetylglucosamine 2-epimerase
MKIVTIVGARPQFIKTAAVSRAIRAHNQAGADEVVEVLIHTGQHYDERMSAVFFAEMELAAPAYYLGAGSGSQAEQTAAMLPGIEQKLLAESPAWVLLYGDTNSTLAGALAASKLRLPIAHIEAGLRSYNRDMPEEINRVITDHVADMLLCPTDKAVENLAQEGISEGVYNVGDVMYDCALLFAAVAMEKSRILFNLELDKAGYYLATVHRQENTDCKEALSGIFGALGQLDLPVVLPLHPRTEKVLRNFAIVVPDNVRLIDPVSYLDMILLEKGARMILTDSGGIQKEAYFFAVPCVTMRRQTEWVETVASGWNILTGPDEAKILEAVARHAQRGESGVDETLFGDGRAAYKILEKLIAHFR